MADLPSGKPPTSVYFNGRILPAAEARLPVSDHGVMFGLGFYETFRTAGACPHLWSLHRARLERACSIAGIRLPADSLARDERRLNDAVRGLLRDVGWADGVCRYTVTAGSPDAGNASPLEYQDPTEWISLRALPGNPPEVGISLRLLQTMRDSGEWIPRPKSINQANVLRGVHELSARFRDPSDEGLFLNADRWVVETPRQNVAWFHEGVMYYPDASTGAIEGTCLTWVLALGVPARAARARIEALLGAEAVIVMNSVRGITPVFRLFGAADELLATLNSRQHPLVVSLRQQWSEAVGVTGRGVAP